MRPCVSVRCDLQMRQFVDAMAIPHHEPLIFAGDFNVDNHSFAAEVAHLVDLLNASAPVQVGSQRYTSEYVVSLYCLRLTCDDISI